VLELLLTCVLLLGEGDCASGDVANVGVRGRELGSVVFVETEEFPEIGTR
jgi:hypothetical protein